MRISEHYPAFTKRTLLVLTNNELAKLYAGDGRDVTEYETLTTPELEPVKRATSAHGVGVPDLDEAKRHRLVELYAAINARLLELTRNDFLEIILCVPEANKNELVAALHRDVAKRVKSLVPKNLASMELGQVLRILFET